jgi:hypothetical protein
VRRGLLVAAAILALAAALLTPANPLTQGAQSYARGVAAASGGVYLTLRSLNAFLSTAQEVEVGGALVVQGSAQPFKVLEPVDDTVERIAQVVFFVMVLTGVLAVAMGPVTGVGLAMTAVALGLAALTRAREAPVLSALARRLGWYGAFLGLAVPLAFVLSALTADRMTEAVWAEHSAIVAEITAEVEGAPEGLAEDVSAHGMMSALQGARDDLDRYRRLAGGLYARADDLVTSLVALLAVFVFKILILPALILGAFFVTARTLARGSSAG